MKITRDELLIAAFKLFMSVNYEKASFAELGKMLGMSKAGIFKYYKNKQELFIAVVDKFWFSTQNPRNKFTETNGTFAEFIDEYVRGVQRTMDMLGDLIGAEREKVALREDVDVEDAVVMFRQVYMGLSFEMAFMGGLNTQRLAKHLHAVYSLLKR